MRKYIPVYVANLFFCLHYAATLYINSTFLEKFVPASEVSLLFLVGALGNLLLFLCVPHLLKRLGNRALFLIFVVLEGLATVGMGLASTPSRAILFFLVSESVCMMIWYTLDIFLESTSDNKKTGEIRGSYLTVGNIAIAAAPLLIPYFSPNGNFSRLYFASAILILPLIYLGLFSFRHFRDGKVELTFFSLPIKIWLQSANVRRSTLGRFALEFFYAAMVIYTPLYLHGVIGFSWTQIGIIFTVMLLPFIFFEIPVGDIADRSGTEREIMTAGFFITGISLLAMPFIGEKFWWWMIALFASRIGASFIEVTSESSFFRRVSKRDTGLISIFRLTRPTSIIAAALVGALSLYFLPFSMIFLVIALFIFLGITQSLYLE